ncbi:MAG: spermidine synthase, partial [Candidatus Binatia bacterium]
VVAFFTSLRQEVGRLVGNIYSLNTLGAILGAFAGGFVFLSLLGIRTTIVAAIVINLYGALLVAVLAPSSLRARVVACLLPIGLIGAIVAMPPAWNSLLMSSGMYQYARHLSKDFSDQDFWKLTEGAWRLLFYEEGLNTTVTVVGNGKDVLLVNNGKIDASSSFDLPTQLLSAHLPLLFHPEARDVCVIGLGSGMTAGSALRHPIQSLALPEIEEEVVAASHYFDDVNHRPLSDPRTESIVADGRTYLSMTRRRFDVIISEPPNPWVSGASNLFTQEFFETARSKLRPQGILGQWIQLYSLPPDDLRSILASFTSVFPHVLLFSAMEGVDIIVVGSEAPLPLDLPALEQRLERVEVAQDLARVQVHEVADLISYFKMGEEEIRALVSQSVLNTDDNLRIEFSAPLYLAANTGGANQQMLDAATAGPIPYLVGLDNPEERASFLASLETAYRGLSRSREAQLVAEALQEMKPESALLQ